jgi:uncharacterized membrane protein
MPNSERRSILKKIVSSLAAPLVVFSFAGLVCAAEPVKKEAAPAAAAPAAGELMKPEKKPVRKARKAKKAKMPRKAEKKEEAPARIPAKK